LRFANGPCGAFRTENAPDAKVISAAA